VSFLVAVQGLSDAGRDRRGALPGSYPIWGFYAPLKLPSWATKYFLDLMLLIRSAERGVTAGTATAPAGKD
jgi:hypothetical protein